MVKLQELQQYLISEFKKRKLWKNLAHVKFDVLLHSDFKPCEIQNCNKTYFKDVSFLPKWVDLIFNYIVDKIPPEDAKYWDLECHEVQDVVEIRVGLFKDKK